MLLKAEKVLWDFFFYRYNITRHHYSFFFFCFICRNSVFNRHLNLGLFFSYSSISSIPCILLPYGSFQKAIWDTKKWLTDWTVCKQTRENGRGKEYKSETYYSLQISRGLRLADTLVHSPVAFPNWFPNSLSRSTQSILSSTCQRCRIQSSYGGLSPTPEASPAISLTPWLWGFRPHRAPAHWETGTGLASKLIFLTSCNFSVGGPTSPESQPRAF